MSMKSYHF